ncbi:MAG: DEAD/DEAH box helicase, partial [Acidimicrobiales bacterium]
MAPPTTVDPDALLRQLAGDPAARLRPGQRQAVEALVDGRRVLLVQRTGWGKTAVYFLATALLRAQGRGPTLLVSPLLALMRNQVEAAVRMGLVVESLTSENSGEWARIEAALAADDVDLLLVSPERLANPRFRRAALPALAGTGLLVVDEAHCISDWGHDFRPDYRRVAAILDDLRPGSPVLACTATANDRVVADVSAQLGDDLLLVRGPLRRDGLSLAVLDLPDQADRLAWLATVLPTLPGTGIVYCLTIRDTEVVASWLEANGVAAVGYSGEASSGDRLAAEAALLGNQVKAVVATSALGMGYDKPDVGFVVHFQSPGSPITYYQQVGRAGRRLDASVGVLLRGGEDARIQDWFITTAFPEREAAEAVVARLGESGPATLDELLAAINVRRTRLEAMLKVLEVEGAVERAERGWACTGRPWAYDAERVEAVTAVRRQEQEQMTVYAEGPGCRMAFLCSLLDDPDRSRCGACDRCTGTSLAATPTPELVAAARRHLRRRPIVLPPKKQWIGATRTRIPPGEQAATGAALGELADGGWGLLVAEGRKTGRFADALLDAAADLARSAHTRPAPTWVTWVPSSRQPALLAQLAAGVGARLDLPVVPAVTRVREAAPQRVAVNSAQQLANVRESFAVEGPLPDGPALLVDDTVQSGWTLTVAAAALRRA